MRYAGTQVAESIPHARPTSTDRQLRPGGRPLEAPPRFVAQLNHPHIVGVIDFDFTEGGRPYLVMERLVGDTLEQRIEQGVLRPLEVALIVRQIAGALKAAHDAGIVHRDLKPANVILVDVPDEPVFVKLIDFGISRSPGERRRKLTRHRDVLGTPHYMAPEQATSQHDLVYARTDQFSLAVVVWEMLTGRVPFDGATTLEVLQQIAHADMPSLADGWPSPVAEHVEAGLARAWRSSPRTAFPT